MAKVIWDALYESLRTQSELCFTADASKHSDPTSGIFFLLPLHKGPILMSAEIRLKFYHFGV